MDRFDILEAMSGIRDEYIEEAAGLPDTVRKASETKAAAAGPGRAVNKTLSGRKKFLHLHRWVTAAAALLCVSVIAVTFQASRQVHNNVGDSMESGLVMMSDESVHVETEEETKNIEAESAGEAAAESYAFETDASEEEAYEDGAKNGDAAVSAPGSGGSAMEQDISVKDAMADASITDDIRQMVLQQVQVFEESLEEETGYPSLRFTHEVTTDSDDWFSLRMLASTPPSEGFEQVTHFNVDKKTGNYMTLETLFGEDPDYITPLSEEVIRQMRGQMDEDPDLQYWIDSDEGPDYDFREISPAQDFYFDRDGNLVLCFNEGEAGPTYMGTVEFTIPSEITRQLLNR